VATPFPPDTAFLTLQRLPVTPAWKVQVCQLLDMDAYAVNLLTRQSCPLVLAATPADLATAAADVVVSSGGLARAPRWATMEALGRPEEVGAFSLGADRLVFELLDGGHAEVERHQLVLAIQAPVKTRTRETRRDPLPALSTPMRNQMGRVQFPEEKVTTTIEFGREEALRLVLREGRILHVGRRCRFPHDWGSAVDWRQHVRRLAPQLQDWDPDVVLDRGFATFIPPRDMQMRMDRFTSSESRETVLHSDAPALEFYTRWRFCLEMPP
jgi:hypothetical protein